MRFNAKSAMGQRGWNGAGKGLVEVELADTHRTLFRESGRWNNGTTELEFTNRYRWTLSANSQSIELEHLRYGSDNPVFLVELVKDSADTWMSANPHICGNDSYSVDINCSGSTISMLWKIRGPEKDEQIRTIYS